ncbi:MAG: acetyltransferase [Candidatus Bipolaricaulaceae bacterium]
MGVYVIGAGGHAKVVLSTLLAAGVQVDGIFDDDPSKEGGEVLGIKVIGPLAVARQLPPQKGVIAIGDNRTRKAIAQEFKNWEWLAVIHPKAYVHPSVRVGQGTVIFAGAVIQPDAEIGEHVIINTGATVDHDCVIGDFAHLAPGVHLAGKVRIEEGVLMGIGSVSLPGRHIGAWAVVGAGAVVIEDLPPRIIAVGVPHDQLEERKNDGAHSHVGPGYL